MTYKTGKRPASYDRRDLTLARYLALPSRPDEFGHERSIGVFPMFANDVVGDCVFAGAAHEHQVWGTEGFSPADFSDASVLKSYSEVTGYVPGDESTDQGTDVRDAMKYRRATGLLDAAGNRHKLAAFLSLEPGNVDHLLDAAWLFGAVGVGIEFPNSAMDQFNAGQPWSVVPGASIEGGHYVPIVGYRRGMFVAVTWGKLQLITPRFFSRYCDEAWCMLCPEILDGSGHSPEGFDLLALQQDLNAL
jgi:hypothetical protein